jgi:type I restriction enzyme S subunit
MSKAATKISLGEITDLVMGQAPPSKDTNFDGRGTPFVKVGEFGETRPVLREWTTKPLRVAHRSDVLLCVVGATCGKINLGEECAIGRSVAAIRPHPSKLDQFYLYYFLMTLVDRLRSGSVGAAQTVISKEMVQTVEIPLPSLSDQQQIVGTLDKVFADIAGVKANAHKSLQNARMIFESELQSIFARRGEGWVDKTLEEIAITFGRGKSKNRPRNEPKLYGGRYPFIQTGDIRNANHFITEYSQTYNEAGLAQSKLWPKGTICITIAANIAETAILGFDACFPDSVIGVVPDPNEADTDFVEYLLQSFKVRLQALGKGSAQANINMGTFEDERFPFPPVGQQKRIVAKLNVLSEEIHNLETVYRRKITALEALQKSMLHQAFAGQLRTTS